LRRLIYRFVAFESLFYFADVQTEDLENTTNITPDVDRLAHEKLQENPKPSTEGTDFYAKEILESQNFLTVSI
jgi:hypothetical protein